MKETLWKVGLAFPLSQGWDEGNIWLHIAVWEPDMIEDTRGSQVQGMDCINSLLYNTLDPLGVIYLLFQQALFCVVSDLMPV